MRGTSKARFGGIFLGAIVAACGAHHDDSPAAPAAASTNGPAGDSAPDGGAAASADAGSGGVLDGGGDSASDAGGDAAARDGAAPLPTLGPDVRWHLDIENPVDTTVDADWFDIDLWDNLGTTTIADVHARARKVVCYFSAGSGENWRPDYGTIPAAALGSAMTGWPGERWLDVRNAGVRAVMLARLDRAKQAGCDGVDPDNVDGYSNSTGFPLTANDQIDFNRFLAREAHARGMVASLKNDVDQIADLATGADSADFAVNEQCFEFGECAKVQAFIGAGKSVLNVEYGDVATKTTTVCPQANAMRFFSILSAQNRMDGNYTRCRN